MTPTPRPSSRSRSLQAAEGVALDRAADLLRGAPDPSSWRDRLYWARGEEARRALRELSIPFSEGRRVCVPAPSYVLLARSRRAPGRRVALVAACPGLPVGSAVLARTPIVVSAPRHGASDPRDGGQLYGGVSGTLDALRSAAGTRRTESPGFPLARRRTRRVREQADLLDDRSPLPPWLYHESARCSMQRRGHRLRPRLRTSGAYENYEPAAGWPRPYCCRALGRLALAASAHPRPPAACCSATAPSASLPFRQPCPRGR